MNPLSTDRIRSVKCFLVIVLSGLYVSLSASRTFNEYALRSAHAERQEGTERRTVVRFDALVRDDFFAGMMGDVARLDRGMKFCEEILAKNPQHAEALVWHGGGLLARAAQAYAKGNSALGDDLWNRGLEEMNKAIAFEPNNMGVKIGRSATLIGLAQSGWDPSDAEARALLLSALTDYEKVYQWQKPFFRELGIHSRGELLFGLASGWSILGEKDKALNYLRLIVEECRGTAYESEARRLLSTKPLPVVQHDCIGCHVK
jgi:tetratricopeptide (TPR) repeat protein